MKKCGDKRFIISDDRKMMKNICRQLLHNSNKPPTFASQFRGMAVKKRNNGSVVQLVRIHACHAWGRGFESRPDRSK